MKKGIVAGLSLIAGSIAGGCISGKIKGDLLNKSKRMSAKHLELFLLMNKWVEVKQEGKCLASYFERNGYKRIAIYGMSYVGNTLVNELRDTGIEVVYGIDKNVDSYHEDIEIIVPSNNMEKVDAIVVTAFTFFDEISDDLSKLIDCPILSIEDVLYEV